MEPGLPYAAVAWLGPAPTAETPALAVPASDAGVVERMPPMGLVSGVRIRAASESTRYCGV